MLRKTYRLMSARIGPPQIIRVHFQPRERAISCWLRQEIRKVLLFVPLIRTTGGRRSKPPVWSFTLALVLPGPFPTMLAGSARTCTPDAVTPGESSPAAAQAAGFEMPALDRAAAIFCCCVMSTALSGADAVDRWITFGEVGE